MKEMGFIKVIDIKPQKDVNDLITFEFDDKVK